MLSFGHSLSPIQTIDPRRLLDWGHNQEVIINAVVTSSGNYGDMVANKPALSEWTVGNQTADTITSVPDFRRYFGFNSLLEKGDGKCLSLPLRAPHSTVQRLLLVARL